MHTRVDNQYCKFWHIDVRILLLNEHFEIAQNTNITGIFLNYIDAIQVLTII